MGLAGHFWYHLRYMSSHFALSGIQVIKKTEIEQALSPFITGYIWSFCVASKDIKRGWRRREKRENHNRNNVMKTTATTLRYEDDWTTYGITKTSSSCVSCLLFDTSISVSPRVPPTSNPNTLPLYITPLVPLRLIWFLVFWNQGSEMHRLGVVSASNNNLIYIERARNEVKISPACSILIIRPLKNS